MEFLTGMMLLLQVVVSIQIMRMGKRMLQRMEILEKKLSCNTELPEVKDILEVKDDEKKDCEPDSIRDDERRKNQEELLNEVLAEVFS